jgi:hypothetical protein
MGRRVTLTGIIILRNIYHPFFSGQLKPYVCNRVKGKLELEVPPDRKAALDVQLLVGGWHVLAHKSSCQACIMTLVARPWLAWCLA